MDYAKMILDAQQKGLTNENKMWQSIAIMEEGLEDVKASKPEKYWKIMRELHKNLYGGHYSEEFAKYDVGKLHWTDNTGQHKGEHWTMEQVKQATAPLTFPQGVNDWDKYVAFNSMYADIAGDADEETILKIAHHFYFADEDWRENAREVTKIWDIMALANC